MSPRRGPQPPPGAPGGSGEDRQSRPKGMQRLGDLLPGTARRLGLDEQLDLSAAMRAWDLIISEHVPEASGSCRLSALRQGVATVQADQPIVAQELRLRATELTAALRSAVRSPVRELRVVVRHV